MLIAADRRWPSLFSDSDLRSSTFWASKSPMGVSFLVSALQKRDWVH